MSRISGWTEARDRPGTLRLMDSPPRFRQARKAIARRSFGDLVVWSSKHGRPISISYPAVEIWNELETGRTVDELTRSMSAAFEGDPGVIARDLEALIGILADLGLIETSA